MHDIGSRVPRRGPRITPLLLALAAMSSTSWTHASAEPASPASGDERAEVDMSSATATEMGKVVKDVSSCEPQLAFERNSSELSAEAKIGLQALSSCLAESPRKHVWLMGSAPDAGSSERAWTLGFERAEAAASYLGTLGVDTQRVTAVSVGAPEDGDGAQPSVQVDAVPRPIVLEPG